MSASEDSIGVLLTQGDKLLFAVAREFCEMNDVMGLACELLEGIGSGGAPFVKRLTAPGGLTDPVTVAHRVLCEWCRVKPKDCYGGKLLNVLKEHHVNPAAAVMFESRLVPGEERREQQGTYSSVCATQWTGLSLRHFA